MVFHNLIQGTNFEDKRGRLSFFNSFVLNEIVRMYEIAPGNTTIIRAWQGHKVEKKWFYCHTGAFVINLVHLDDFEHPSPLLKPKRIVLDAKNPTILTISGGYATGFKASKKKSKLQVFSNFNLDESKNDDFRYPIDKWEAQW